MMIIIRIELNDHHYQQQQQQYSFKDKKFMFFHLCEPIDQLVVHFDRKKPAKQPNFLTTYLTSWKHLQNETKLNWISSQVASHHYTHFETNNNNQKIIKTSNFFSSQTCIHHTKIDREENELTFIFTFFVDMSRRFFLFCFFFTILIHFFNEQKSWKVARSQMLCVFETNKQMAPRYWLGKKSIHFFRPNRTELTIIINDDEEEA